MSFTIHERIISLRPALILKHYNKDKFKRTIYEFLSKPRQLTDVGIVWVIIAVILGGILIDIKIAEAYEYVEVEAITAVVEPKEVKIEVVYSKEGIERLIRKTFPEAPNTAVAIAKCESGLDSDIQSHHTLSYGREQSYGVFQIHAKDHDRTATRLGLEDYKTQVEDNVKMARHLFDARGNFKDWTCYNSGAYKKFL
jgi:hypothetical protein